MATGESVSPILDSEPEPVAVTLHRYQPLFLASASALLILGLFWRTGLSMVTSWSESRTFSHGFLIVPVFFYLMWVRRHRIFALRLRPNFWGLPAIAALGCGWFLANMAEIRMLQQFALVGMLIAVVWTVLGTDFVRAFRFPLAFLIFCVPFGESIVSPLQDVTAWFAVAALKLSNIPVIRENRTITVPSGVWEVAEACSGIRYMFSSLVLGVLYAAFVYRSAFRRSLFIFASLAVPIAANGLRAYGIILLGYLWSNELASGIAHIIYGLVFFTLVEFVLFLVGFRWHQPKADEFGVGDSRPGANAYARRAGWVVALCAVALVGWLPAAAEHVWSRGSTAPAATELYAPLSVQPPWKPVAVYDIRWQPSLQPDRDIGLSYSTGSRRVDLYLASYSGRHALQLVNGYNRVKDSAFWFDEPGPVRQVIVGGQSLDLPQRFLRSSSGQRVDWIFYWVDGEFTASPGRVKYLLARARILGHSPAASIIALSSNFSSDPSEAEKDLQNFLSCMSLAPVSSSPASAIAK